uniref:Uncharacterized protein n=1 Tax=Anguilla anguilla TaxID=7936 RepID=A0A0E9V6B8_ANGAN
MVNRKIRRLDGSAWQLTGYRSHGCTVRGRLY